MQVLKIAEVGDVVLRKLSKRDWELIRNNCISIDPKTRTEKTDAGSFIKYLVVLGINKAPFFKSEYLDNSRLDIVILNEREEEYYNSNINQNVFDKIFSEVRKYNEVNDTEIKEVSKE